MERFSCSTEIISGSGAVSFLKTLRSKRAFLVTDPYFVKSGMAETILSQVGAEKQKIFSEVTPDPSAVLAAKGTASFLDFDPDLLIALGGGSSLDTAKAICYFGRKKIPFAAIPTTSGSGSEVTNFSILTHEGIKHPLVDPALQPDYAILDSDLLRSLPGALIADAGFDVLSHALEAIAGRKAGRLSDLLSMEAFRLCWLHLKDSYEGRQDCRLPVHEAATMAGIAFSQAGLGLCHALSHALGGRFHVPHGRLNAILLPAVVEANSKAAGHKYAELARFAGLEGKADLVALRNLKNGLIRLRKQLNLPGTLSAAGISPAELKAHREAIVEAARKDPCCETNPVPVDSALIKSVLREVT